VVRTSMTRNDLRIVDKPSVSAFSGTVPILTLTVVIVRPVHGLLDRQLALVGLLAVSVTATDTEPDWAEM
jgi:hypothetical protein